MIDETSPTMVMVSSGGGGNVISILGNLKDEGSSVTSSSLIEAKRGECGGGGNANRCFADGMKDEHDLMFF